MRRTHVVRSADSTTVIAWTCIKIHARNLCSF